MLRALLPELGTDIKGHMRSQAELLEASGYQDQPAAFTDLLRILDGELRLITPTDPEGHESQSKSDSQTQYYQLTHDYLVPSLREWLTRKQRETRRGRAELRLAERTAGWSALRESKQLPTLWEWLNIGLLTDGKNRTKSERVMMNKATKVHGVRSGLALAGLIAMVVIGSAVRNQVSKQQEVTRIEGLVGRLVSAEPNQLTGVIEELDANSEIAEEFLSPLLTQQAETLDEKRSQLHARLASVGRDKSLIEPLLEELLTNKVAYVGPIRQQLRPYAGELSDRLWGILRDETAAADRRFRVAVALADYVPESEAPSWSNEDLTFVARQLVSANAELQPLLRENLRPIYGRLLSDLATIFSYPTATDAQRLSAANAFADYAASDIAKLSELLTVATPEQYAVLYPLVAAIPSPETIIQLSEIASTLPPDDLGSVPRIAYGQRRANAAVSILQLGEREKVLPVFDWTDDPEALTQFVFRCKPRGISVDSLLDLLELFSTATSGTFPKDARYALLLAIGEYAPSEIPSARREALVNQLADWYSNDPSSGVHGASGWLLRHLGQREIADRVDHIPISYSPEREWFTLAITVKPTPPPRPKPENNGESESSAAKAEESDSNKSELQEPEQPLEPLPTKTFYYTFIVHPSGECAIGSQDDQPGRQKEEIRHVVTLTRPFALLDREITFEELITFSPQFAGFMQQYDAQPTEAGFGAAWYDAVAYCRWLDKAMGLRESDHCYADPETLDKEKYARDPQVTFAPRNWPLALDKRGFRLPTESEWEVVARNGSRTAYGFGSEAALLNRFGWFNENSGKHVHPGRELRPNVGGLFDLHGNLFEWTHDWYGDYVRTMQTDPLGVKEGWDRVHRGGCWGDGAAFCRSAFRSADVPSDRSIIYGFRLALSPSRQVQAEPGKGAKPSGGGTEGASAEQRPEMP